MNRIDMENISRTDNRRNIQIALGSRSRTFFFSSRRRHTMFDCDWSSDVCSSDLAGPPAPAMPQFFWLWSPTNFEDTCTHFDVNENADGSRWHEFGSVTRADPNATLDLSTAVNWKVDYAPGTRHAKSAEILLRAPGAT